MSRALTSLAETSTPRVWFYVLCAGKVCILEVNPDPGLSMYHVLPPTRAADGTPCVVPGSVLHEFGVWSTAPHDAATGDADDVTSSLSSPPEGCLTIPTWDMDPVVGPFPPGFVKVLETVS
jgi:hypothetical protein